MANSRINQLTAEIMSDSIAPVAKLNFMFEVIDTKTKHREPVERVRLVYFDTAGDGSPPNNMLSLMMCI